MVAAGDRDPAGQQPGRASATLGQAGGRTIDDAIVASAIT
jgi:hypothetical protein